MEVTNEDTISLKAPGPCRAQRMAGKINTCALMTKPLSKCSLGHGSFSDCNSIDILKKKNSPTKHLSCWTCCWHTLRENQKTLAQPLSGRCCLLFSLEYGNYLKSRRKIISSGGQFDPRQVMAVEFFFKRDRWSHIYLFLGLLWAIPQSARVQE